MTISAPNTYRGSIAILGRPGMTTVERAIALVLHGLETI